MFDLISLAISYPDESTLIWWETCEPKLDRIVCQFEEEIKDDGASFHTTSTNHHKDNEDFQLNFRKEVQTVFNTIPCKPFQLDSLYTINDIAYTFPRSVAETIQIALFEGETQDKIFHQWSRNFTEDSYHGKDLKKKQIFFTGTWRNKQSWSQLHDQT